MSIYDTLEIPDDGVSIRLLTINPSRQRHSLVTCQLRVAAIHDGLEYEALSYCWGDSKLRATISVNGKSVSVTKSLGSALHALRDSNAPRTLWVDAVCINQDDLDEKSFQVPLMGFIYGKCVKCLIWLGESDKESRKAFDLIRRGIKEYPRILSSVLRRQWFTRVWIIQEVALAPVALVHCGQDVIHWDQLAAIVALVPPLGSFVNPTPVEGSYKHLHPAYYLRILNYARQRMSDGLPFDIHQALRSFQPFDATHSVDKVFGILSLLEDPTVVQVNYTLSPREVYQRVALSILRSSKGLDLFLDCIPNVNGARIKGLPSWAPDWSATDQPLDNPVDTVTATERFDASAGKELNGDIHDRDGVLTLQGHIVGKIVDLGTPIPSIQELRAKYWPVGQLFPRKNALSIITDAPAILNSWKLVVSRTSDGSVKPLASNYVTGEPLLEALYHTLNANGGPFSDETQDRDFMRWVASCEFIIGICRRFGRMMSVLPWFLLWIISGPYFASHSFIIGFKFIRGQLLFDAPVSQVDASRQTWVVGRMEGDLMGLFPCTSLTNPDTIPSKVGDSVVIFKGGRRPYVIRQEEKGWKILGNAYVHGIMYGAAYNSDMCVELCLL